MKKELMAIGLLVLILTACLFNIRYADSFIGEIISDIEKAEKLAENGDWANAEASAETALKIWKEHHRYARMTLTHSDVEQITAAILELQNELRSKDIAVVIGKTETAIAYLNSMRDQERVSLESIF